MGALLSSLSWSSVQVSRRAVVTIYLPLAAVTYITYCFGIKPFLSPLRKIPGMPYHPIFGNIREAIKGQAMEASIRWVAKYGGVLRYYSMFGKEAVLVADPDAFKQVFVTDQHKYGRPTPKNTPLGRSVLTLTGAEHRAHRLLLNPVFSPDIIKGHVTRFAEYGRRLEDHWCHLLENGQTNINIQEQLFRMTFDVFGKAVFGRDFNSLQDQNLGTVLAFKELLSIDSVSVTGAIPFYKYLPTKKNRERARCSRVVNAFIYSLLEEKKQLLKINEVSREEVRRDLLGCLLLARDEESGHGLTPKEILDELVTLIFAGYETTAMTMSWVLLTLAQHQDVQRKLRSEINATLFTTTEPAQSTTTRPVQSTTTGPMQWEQLESMQYLDCVIKECQRLYPAASTVLRYAAVDTYLGPYFIPRGTSVVCHIGTMMRSARVWDDPGRFLPDRFLDTKPGLYTFLPFGTGPTKCLGHLFARTQMKVVLSTLLHRFQFETIPGCEFRRKHQIILKAVPSIKLAVKLAEQE